MNKGSTEVRWLVSLKISAPKIILPDCRQLESQNHNCVLVDLGRLYVSNCPDRQIDVLLKITDSAQMGYESDIDSDDFVTPASSPIGSLEDISMEVDRQDSLEVLNASNIYDVYSVTLENVMALVGTWNELENTFSKNVHKAKDLILMEPFNLQLEFKRKCVVDKLSKFPNLVMESTLSKLLINISDYKLALAKGCLEHLTSLANNYPKSGNIIIL